MALQRSYTDRLRSIDTGVIEAIFGQKAHMKHDMSLTRYICYELVNNNNNNNMPIIQYPI